MATLSVAAEHARSGSQDGSQRGPAVEAEAVDQVYMQKETVEGGVEAVEVHIDEVGVETALEVVLEDKESRADTVGITQFKPTDAADIPMETHAVCVDVVDPDPAVVMDRGAGPINDDGLTQAELVLAFHPPANTQRTATHPKYMKAINAPILTTPATKVPCKANSKKASASMDTDLSNSRKSKRLANRLIGELTMEEQATALLMKKCNFLDKKQKPDAQQKTLFCSSFADPLPQKEVTQYRTMFNLEEADGTDIRSAVAVHADA